MRDLLTEEECREILQPVLRPFGYYRTRNICAALQAAARLGAERERERAARVCDDLATECKAKWLAENPSGMFRAGYDDWEAVTIETADDCAAAIRRGEGEQA